METPVLLIVFNRPETTKVVLDSIRSAAPRRLFVAADGPRPGNATDPSRCREVLFAVERSVDWDCKVEYFVHKDNLGCGKAPSSAITWFFDNVEEGIILEDDCRPVPQFFPFCSSLLEKYRNESRVAQIGGFNCQSGRKRGRASYYFSRYFHCWGWASWSRAWEAFDFEMTDYADFSAEGGMENLFERRAVREFWEHNFDDVLSGKIDGWDYQWAYHNFKKDALSVVPNANMIDNIGFGMGATHTFSTPHRIDAADAGSLGHMVHPHFIVPCQKADDFTYRHHLKLGRFHEAKQLAKRALRFFRLRA